VLAHHPYFHHLTRRERKDAARHFFPVSVQKGTSAVGGPFFLDRNPRPETRRSS
jgi:hypothetical protein